jgi:hypothetical protein
MSLATKLSIIFCVVLCPPFLIGLYFIYDQKVALDIANWAGLNAKAWGLVASLSVVASYFRYHFICCLLVLITYLYLCFELILLEETGGGLSLDHLSLIFNAFDDSWAVLTGTATSTNLVLLLFALMSIAACFPLINALPKPSKQLLLVSLTIVGFSFAGVVKRTLEANAAVEDNAHTVKNAFNGRLKSLSKHRLPDQVEHNVLIYIYESLSWRYSSFSNRYGSTEYLKALAIDGVLFERAHAITPHSSKSIFSILCGSMPLLNQEIIETASNLDATCLPHLYQEHGYESIFMQSASGGFESRPRLAKTMGYSHFIAREDLASKKLGYLASDDAKLESAFSEYIAQESEPFFATVFTSAAHHPYVLPEEVSTQGNNMNAFERYLLLQKRADQTLETMVKKLRETNRYDNTLIIALGDHGEGFGEFGVKQHDMNFYDEGLHVPVVVKFPKEKRFRQLVNQNYEAVISLKDIVPFVMNQLEAPFKFNSLLARKMKAQSAGEKKVFFNCWYEKNCFGWIADHQKTVLMLKENRKKVFTEDAQGVPTLVLETGISQDDHLVVNDLFQAFFNELWLPEYKLVSYASRNGVWICEKKRCKFKVAEAQQ